MFYALLSSSPARAGVVIVVGGLLLAGAYYGISRMAYQLGWDAALDRVAQQNSVAADAARKVKDTVSHCYDEGGEWDASTGSCNY